MDNCHYKSLYQIYKLRPNSEEKLDMIVRILEEQLRWDKLTGLSQLKAILEQNLKDEKEKQVSEFILQMNFSL